MCDHLLGCGSARVVTGVSVAGSVHPLYLDWFLQTIKNGKIQLLVWEGYEENKMDYFHRHMFMTGTIFYL